MFVGAPVRLREPVDRRHFLTMETIQYTYVNRKGWDNGEWDQEPDKIQFEDPNTKLPCLIVRNPMMGFLCGYVGVPEGHPYFGKDSDEIDIACHGGLTFSNFCAQDDKEHGICHRPAPGEPDKVWWLGFDCGHAFDLGPGMVANLKKAGVDYKPWCGDQYRDLAYVKAQCASIAKQLALIFNESHPDRSS